MPRSRRSREVALTKVRKTPSKEKKDNLIVKIHDAVEQYAHGLILRVENQRNDLVKQVRAHFQSNSLLFMGKNSVMKLALGSGPETEVADKIHELAERIEGTCALMLTNEEPEKVQQYFTELTEASYARCGHLATETFTLEEGQLPFPHSLEAQLRSLGMPTKLHDAKVLLLSNFTVCREGKPLTVDQAQILKLFDKKTSAFTMTPTCVWTKSAGGSVKDLQKTETK